MQDEAIVDRICCDNVFKTNLVCAFEFCIECVIYLRFQPRPEPALSNDTQQYACAGEKRGHHIGGALLPS